MNSSQPFRASDAAPFNKVLQAINYFVFGQDHVAYKARFLFVRLGKRHLAGRATKALIIVAIPTEFLCWPVALFAVHNLS